MLFILILILLTRCQFMSQQYCIFIVFDLKKTPITKKKLRTFTFEMYPNYVLVITAIQILIWYQFYFQIGYIYLLFKQDVIMLVSTAVNVTPLVLHIVITTHVTYKRERAFRVNLDWLECIVIQVRGRIWPLVISTNCVLLFGITCISILSK